MNVKRSLYSTLFWILTPFKIGRITYRTAVPETKPIKINLRFSLLKFTFAKNITCWKQNSYSTSAARHSAPDLLMRSWVVAD